MCDKELLVGYLYDEVDRGGAADDGVAPSRMRRVPERAEGPSRHPNPPCRVGAADSRARVPDGAGSGSGRVAGAAVVDLAGVGARRRRGSGSFGRVRNRKRRGQVRPGRPDGPHRRVARVSRPAGAGRRRRIDQAISAPTTRVSGAELQAIAIGFATSRPAGNGTRPVLTSVHVPATQPPAADVLRAVRQLIADSESRQEQELARRLSQVLRDVEGLRRVDLDRVQRALAEMQGVTDTTIIRQREIENHLLRVVTAEVAARRIAKQRCDCDERTCGHRSGNACASRGGFGAAASAGRAAAPRSDSVDGRRAVAGREARRRARSTGACSRSIRR